MNVYEQISSNKIRTWLILFIFIFLLSGVFYLVGLYFESPQAYFTFGFIFSLLSGAGSYFYSDKLVLATTRARPANKREHFHFYTVVENLTTAAGLPMPRLYVVDDPSPNAFATGRNPRHAVVAVTTGLLSRLDRSDLEGVISHELSHVKNYDILVSSIVAVLVGTLALAADFILRSMWWGRGDSDRNGRNPMVFVLLLVALILAPIAASLIQLAVSRRRELLADASGVMLTRNPDGLADALEKIATDPHSPRFATTSTAHLFIANPFKKTQKASWFAGLFNTHPPIEERIKLLRRM